MMDLHNRKMPAIFIKNSKTALCKGFPEISQNGALLNSSKYDVRYETLNNLHWVTCGGAKSSVGSGTT